MKVQDRKVLILSRALFKHVMLRLSWLGTFISLPAGAHLTIIKLKQTLKK